MTIIRSDSDKTIQPQQLQQQQQQQQLQQQQQQHNSIMSRCTLLLLFLPRALSQCNPCDLTPNGFAAVPGTMCIDYVNCFNGAEVMAQTCGAGLIFEVAIAGCNWADMVTCPPDPPCNPTVANTVANTTTSLPTTWSPKPTQPSNPIGTNATLLPPSSNSTISIPVTFTVFGLTNSTALQLRDMLEMILFEIKEFESIDILNVVPHSARILEQQLQFNVLVAPKEGVDPTSLIVDALSDRYEEILEAVRGWMEPGYLTTDFGFELCAEGEGGEYLCTEVTETGSTGAAIYRESVGSTEEVGGEGEEGMPTWIIVVISLVSVLLLCCTVAGVVFLGCHGWEEGDYTYKEEDSRQLAIRHGEEYAEGGYVDEGEHPEGGRSYRQEEESRGSRRSVDGSERHFEKDSGRRSYREEASGARSYREEPSGARSYREEASEARSYREEASGTRSYREDPSVRKYEPEPGGNNSARHAGMDPDDQFGMGLESLGSHRSGSRRMDHSVVSELSEPSRSLGGKYT